MCAGCGADVYKSRGPTINEHGNVDPMPKKGRSKSQTRPQASDDSDEICRQNGWTAHQYAQMYHHMQGHAPAPAGRARGSSRARSNGGQSGRTTREPSQDPVRERDMFRVAVRMRYNEACDFYRSNQLFKTHELTREAIMAKAYEMQRKGAPHDANVVNEMIAHGHADSKNSTDAQSMFPDLDKKPWTSKKISNKTILAKMWVIAMDSMAKNNYLWYDHFSKRELRALLIQQFNDEETERELSLQDYVKKHSTPKREWLFAAENMYRYDSETREPHLYEDRKHGSQYMTPKYMQYMTPGTHDTGGGALHTAPQTAPHHEFPHTPAMPVVERTGLPPPRSSGGKKGQTPALLTGGSELKGGSSYAHDDFGDEVPDDYRV